MKKIVPVNVGEQFKSDYQRYGIYVTYKRILSDMRDGLKPVQRRVLYTMLDIGATDHTVKSATITGSCMRFHPHGNCLSGDTLVSSTDGKTYTMEQLFYNNSTINVNAVDPDTGWLISTVAHDFRIGQYTDEIYHLYLSNGAEIKCTGNHPFMIHDYSFVEAKDLEVGSMLTVDAIAQKENGQINVYATIEQDTRKVWVTVDKIWVEKVDHVPMYDFTVDKYENMVIPAINSENTGIIPFICVHNSGIYDSMKSMANWFECYLPLLDRQGNFGSFFGEPASAERYTEAKLSKFALDYVVGDLRDAPESIDWEPNYDNTLKEPSYLPAAIPILLINGSFGIGLGKKVDIPSHNTNEVIDAMIGLIQNPNMPVTLIPDTCMSCEIFDDGNWEEISNTGYGYFTVRGVAKIETYSNDKYKNRPAVVIYSVPDMIYIDRIKEQVEKLVEKKKLVQIDDMYDESSEYKPRFVIVLKQGSDASYVREVLYQNTFLQVTQRVNFEFLNGLTPVRMSYRDYLLNFIENRKQVKYRVFINRLRVLETKIHEKEAFIKLLESPHFEEIMDKIRKFNKDNKELIEYLIKQLGITDVQARYIIDSRLSSITRNSLSKLKADMKSFTDLKDTYMDLVVNENSLTRYIIAELEDIKTRYGCPRRSKLVHKVSSKDAIPSGIMTIVITEKGYIKKVPSGSPTGNFRNDMVKSIIEIDNADNLVIFDSSGKVYKLPIYKLPFGDKNSAGIDLRFIFKTFNGVAVNAFPESVLKKFVVKNKSKNRFSVITLTKQGFIKRMEVEEFFNITSAGLTYAKMDAGDYIQSVCLVWSENDIIVFSGSKAMRIASSSIPTMKRAARGNMTVKSKSVDGMSIGMVNTSEYVIVITRSGKINKIPVKGVPGLMSNKKEFSLIRLGKTDAIQNVLFANGPETLVMRCGAGEFKFPVSTIAMGSSITGGDKVLSLKNDQVYFSMIG